MVERSPIPEPSSLEDIDVSGAVPMLVPLPDGRGRAVRLKNITMDGILLEESIRPLASFWAVAIGVSG